MTAEQVGVYILLLCEQWDAGPIPDEDDELAFIGKVGIDVVRVVLRLSFELTPEGWVNEVLAEVRDEQEMKARALSIAGKAGAKARWDKGGNGNRIRPQSEAYGIREEKRREEKKTTAAAVGDFLEVTSTEWRLSRPIEEWCREIETDAKYAGADLPYEIRKCRDWHNGRGKRPKSPDIAIRNWLERAARSARGTDQPPLGLDIPLERLT